MNKKVYVQPSVSVYEMEVEPILAGTTIMSGTTSSGDNLEYGGDTKPGGEYEPW